MLDQLPPEILLLIGAQISQRDRWSCTDTCRYLRNTFLGDRYSKVVLGLGHFFNDKSKQYVHEIGLWPFHDKRMFIPSECWEYLVEILRNGTFLQTFASTVLIHWSDLVNDELDALLELFCQRFGKDNVHLRVVQHLHSMSPQRAAVLKQFLESNTKIKLTNWQARQFKAADFTASDKMPTRLRLNIGEVKPKILLDPVEYRLPMGIPHIELAPRGGFRISSQQIDIFLKCNLGSQIDKLTLEGEVMRPLLGGEEMAPSLTIPKSVKTFNNALSYYFNDIYTSGMECFEIDQFHGATNLSEITASLNDIDMTLDHMTTEGPPIDSNQEIHTNDTTWKFRSVDSAAKSCSTLRLKFDMRRLCCYGGSVMDVGLGYRLFTDELPNVRRLEIVLVYNDKFIVDKMKNMILNQPQRLPNLEVMTMKLYNAITRCPVSGSENYPQLVFHEYDEDFSGAFKEYSELYPERSIELELVVFHTNGTYTVLNNADELPKHKPISIPVITAKFHDFAEGHV